MPWEDAKVYLTTFASAVLLLPGMFLPLLFLVSWSVSFIESGLYGDGP